MEFKDILIEFNDDGRWSVSNLDYDGTDEDYQFLAGFNFKSDAYQYAFKHFLNIKDKDKLLVVMDARNRDMEFVCYGEADTNYLLQQLQEENAYES